MFEANFGEEECLSVKWVFRKKFKDRIWTYASIPLLLSAFVSLFYRKT